MFLLKSEDINIPGAFMETPIVFIHYGDTPYLKYALSLAQKTNPEKEVILLGDRKNKKYEGKLGIRHIFFSRYDMIPEIGTFARNFTYVGGANRQTAQDKRFEFFCHVRWFYLLAFMKESTLSRCWYFDSDTLILSPLSDEEKKFAAYDITEQSNGMNMKGLIRIEQLEHFTKTINELFAGSDYVERQRKELERYPDYALSDMRAYAEFKKAYRPKTISLNTIFGNETHDECICQEDGMETEYDAHAKRMIKKLYFKDGAIREKTGATHELIKLQSINMSWVPTALIERLWYYKMHSSFPPFYLPLWWKTKRIPRFIKTLVTKETK